MDVTPTAEELARLEATAPGLALQAAARRELTPAELGRDPGRCRAEGCGYVVRCFSGARTG